jgi:hypothetical protein
MISRCGDPVASRSNPAKAHCDRRLRSWPSGGFRDAQQVTFVFTIAIVCMVAISGCSGQRSNTPHAVPTKEPPSPAAYTNEEFKYSLSYPSVWQRDASSDGASVRFFFTHNLNTPEAVAIDLVCRARADNETPSAVWQSTRPASGTEAAIGPVTLRSGVTAYAASGHGQTSYTVYTMVQGSRACQLVTYQATSSNSRYVQSTLDSFTWQG